MCGKAIRPALSAKKIRPALSASFFMREGSCYFKKKGKVGKQNKHKQKRSIVFKTVRLLL